MAHYIGRMVATDVLRLRDFRLILLGQGLSWVGDAFNPIALSTAIVIAGGGAHELGLILASAVVARLVCSLLGGVWADRLTPHRIMVGADLVRAASVTGMTVAFAVGDPPVALLAGLAAVTAGAGAFFFPAFVSLRPLVVPPAQRQSANALVTFLQSSAQVAGPVLAGLVVATAGPVWGFGVNALTFAWSAVCVARVSARAERMAQRRSMLAETRDGLAEIRRHDWLSTGLVSAGMFHVASGVSIVLVEILAVRHLGGPQALGLITASLGVGGILGGLVALRLQPRRMLLWAFAALALYPLFPAAFAWPGTLVTIMVAACVAQAGLMFFDVGWETALQTGIPHDRLARVASWDILISYIAMPLGNVLAGPLTARFETRHVMGGVAAWMLLAGCWPLLVRGVRAFTAAPAPDPRDDRGQESAATAAS